MDPWLEGLWKAIKEELSNMASKTTECLKEEASDSSKETPDPSTADVRLNLLSIADSQNCGSMGQSGKLAASASPPVSTTQSAISDVRQDSSSNKTGLASQADGAFDADGGVASLTRSLPPLSESALNVPALPPPYLSVSLQDLKTTEDVRMIDKVSICVIVGLKSHSCFSLDFWTIKQRDSSRGAHIEGRSVDQGRVGEDSRPLRAGHHCKFECVPQFQTCCMNENMFTL